VVQYIFDRRNLAIGFNFFLLVTIYSTLNTLTNNFHQTHLSNKSKNKKISKHSALSKTIRQLQSTQEQLQYTQTQVHTHEQEKKTRIPEAVWLLPSKTWQPPKKLTREKPITVVIPSYNNSKWYKYNLSSIFAQEYSNYNIIYIDDCSPDNTGSLVEQFIKQQHQEKRITLIKNKKRMGGALGNIYKAAQMTNPQNIIAVVDGDDWLAHCQVFQLLNEVYDDPNVWLTYGQLQIFPSNDIGWCQDFPAEVIKNNLYRSYPWISSHLRTCYAWLFHKIELEDLFYENDFYSAATDQAYMFPLLEMTGGKFKFIPHINYIYNQANEINVNKIKQQLQTFMAQNIRNKPAYKAIEHRISK